MQSGRARGFTLMELLVVMAIIGLLSGIMLTALRGNQQKARDNGRQTDLHAVQLALDLYMSAYGTYPSGPWSGLSVLVAKNFLAALPNDPLGGTNQYGYTALDSAGSTSCNAADPCVTDYLGAIMERAGTGALSSDSDDSVSISINGTPHNCNESAGNPGATETVYCAKGSAVPGA